MDPIIKGIVDIANSQIGDSQISRAFHDKLQEASVTKHENQKGYATDHHFDPRNLQRGHDNYSDTSTIAKHCKELKIEFWYQVNPLVAVAMGLSNPENWFFLNFDDILDNHLDDDLKKFIDFEIGKQTKGDLVNYRKYNKKIFGINLETFEPQFISDENGNTKNVLQFRNFCTFLYHTGGKLGHT